MSRRSNDRVKVGITWDEVSCNPLGEWAAKYVREIVAQAVPAGESAHGLRVVKSKDDAYRLKLVEDTRFELEYVMRYKTDMPGRRMPRWASIFRYAIRLKELANRSPADMNVCTTIDLQANRMPWVFVRSGENKVLSHIATRPGAKEYIIRLPKPVAMPKAEGRRLHFLNQTTVTFTPPTADEIRIVGEPRAAYKAYRYFKQLERGNPLSSRDRHDQTKVNAMGDLVCVMVRNTERCEPWHLYSDDNHTCGGLFMTSVLSSKSEEQYQLDLGYDVTALAMSSNENDTSL